MNVGTRLKIGLFFFMSFSVAGQVQEGYGRIKGRVVCNRNAVLDVTVLAINKDGYVHGKAFTDSNGWFIIERLRTDQSYVLKAFHRDYDTSLVVDHLTARKNNTQVEIMLFPKGKSNKGVIEVYAFPLILDSVQKNGNNK